MQARTTVIDENSTTPPNGTVIPLARALHPKKSYWDRFIDFLAFVSEAANVGIVIEIAAKWWPPLLTIGSGFLANFAQASDAVIYCCKALIRLTRIIGRDFFGAKFEEENNGVHRFQTAGDLTSLLLFSLAVALFLGKIVAGPVGITLAWIAGLSGLSVVGFFDYYHQAKLAKEKFAEVCAEEVAANERCENLAADPNHSPLELQNAKQNLANIRIQKAQAEKEYKTRRNSYYLFMGLLVGLVALLVCGSAVAFAPPLLVPVLFITSKIASGYLALIACGRFLNWALSSSAPKPAPEVAPTPAETLSTILMTRSLHQLLAPRLAQEQQVAADVRLEVPSERTQPPALLPFFRPINTERETSPLPNSTTPAP